MNDNMAVWDKIQQLEKEAETISPDEFKARSELLKLEILLDIKDAIKANTEAIKGISNSITYK